MQLPLDQEGELQALEALLEFAELGDLTAQDLAIQIKQDTEAWSSSSKASQRLLDVQRLILESRPDYLAELDGDAYIQAYKKLREPGKNQPAVSHLVAVRLLSRAGLISHFLRDERFSCSQVARVINSIEPTLKITYSAVSFVAKSLDLAPALDSYEAGPELWAKDQEASQALFPDSGLEETNQLAAELLETWIPDHELEIYLHDLTDPVDSFGNPNWPYFQMLHWCLTPLEFYDHPPSYLYEFSPRGKLALAICALYPAATGNAILNNAKAVEALNSTWASNRGGSGANALFKILELLDSLPYVSRRQVARLLRAWLFRILFLQTSEPQHLPLTRPLTDFFKISSAICSGESSTHGVLEQRIVDCLASLAFNTDGWVPRGIGDGVNVTNFSRKKLGDVEFVNVDERRAIAVEAHGGYLSQTYADEHRRSLNRIIERRLTDSWASLDAPQAWTVNVIFVSHTKDSSPLMREEHIHDVHVLYEYLSFGDLRKKALEKSTPEQQEESFLELVLRPLNSKNVPETVRERYRELLASDTLTPSDV